MGASLRLDARETAGGPGCSTQKKKGSVRASRQQEAGRAEAGARLLGAFYAPHVEALFGMAAEGLIAPPPSRWRALGGVGGGGAGVGRA